MKYFRFALSITVSILIFAFLLVKLPYGQIVSIISHCQISLLLLGILVGGLSIFLNAMRWQILLKYISYRYDFKLLSKLAFISLFFNVYLPGGIAGDVTRVVMLPDKKIHITASVIADRVIGLAGLMFLAVLGAISNYRLLLNTQTLLIFLIMVSAIFAIFLILFTSRAQVFVKRIFALPLIILSPAKRMLQNTIEALFVYRNNYIIFAKTIPVSILGHLCVVTYFFISARSLGIDINFLRFLAFIPIIEFISALPISLGGAGIREAATILFFSSIGTSAAEAMSISLLSFVVILVLGAIGGILFLCWKK